MKIIILFSALLLSTIVQSQNFIHGTPYIEVTGEGTLDVIPDKIVIRIKLSEYDRKKEPVEEREIKMREVLESIGINTTDELAVLDFDSNYGYAFGRSIRSSKQYELTLNNPELVSTVFLKLEEIDISNLDIVEVTHSKLGEYEQLVKFEAVKSAKSKADGMLEQLGQEVGKTLFIEEKEKFLPSEYFQNYSRYAYSNRMNGTGAVSRSVSDTSYEMPVLSFKKIELAYNVLVRFEIL